MHWLCIRLDIGGFLSAVYSSANPQRKWINPGACAGPYLPLYGCGVCILYLLAELETIIFCQHTTWSCILTLAVMAICMTVIEYIAGICTLKWAKVRLWDYSAEWGNIQGVICPKFSLVWAAICVFYYLCLHPHILQSVEWFQRHPHAYFGIGVFYGIFAVDVVKSAQLVGKLKKYAEENHIIIRYEAIKAEVRHRHDESKTKYHFLFPFQSRIPLSEHLRNLKDSFERVKENKKKIAIYFIPELSMQQRDGSRHTMDRFSFIT